MHKEDEKDLSKLVVSIGKTNVVHLVNMVEGKSYKRVLCVLAVVDELLKAYTKEEIVEFIKERNHHDME